MAIRRINAKVVLGTEQHPSGDGERLADHLHAAGEGVQDLVIDVRDLAPEDFVSSFVNSLFHYLEERGVPRAHFSTVRWETKYESERRKLDSLVLLYLSDPDTGESPIAAPLPRRAGGGGTDRAGEA